MTRDDKDVNESAQCVRHYKLCDKSVTVVLEVSPYKYIYITTKENNTMEVKKIKFSILAIKYI